MQVTVAAPQSPRPFRPRQLSRSFEVIQALRSNPVGWWIAVHLSDVPGSTTKAKQTSVARAARRHFKPIHVHTENDQLFVRIVPNRNKPSLAQPIDWTKRPRPVFCQPPQAQSATPDSVAVA
jgi:hypothetical protein